MNAWKNDAACRDEDPALFFPDGESGPANRRQIQRAKSFCHRCPVADDCLDEAIERREYGIWGGFTDEERRILRRRLTRRVS